MRFSTPCASPRDLGPHRDYPARMRGLPQRLINTPEIEIWPAGLLKARGNHDARAIVRTIVTEPPSSVG